MKISKRAQAVQPSATLATSAKAKALRAQGIDIISLAAGEPDFNTPAHIVESAKAAMDAGFTKYPLPVPGIPELREAIVAKFEQDQGLKYTPDQILVSSGAKHVIFNVMMALLDDGDEVIIPAPYWVSYPEQARAAGAVPVTVDTGKSFKITPAQLEWAITPKTQLLIINSPGNPTGAVYSLEELRGLAEVLKQHDFMILSDEIYEKIVYEGNRHISIASLGDDLKERTIVVNGHSKAYSMTGWRLGYCAAPTDLVKAAGRLQGQSTSGAASFVQKAGVVALQESQSCVDEMLAAFDERRKFLVARMSEILGEEVPPPGGTFYLFADMSQLIGLEHDGEPIKDTFDLVAYFMEQAHVAMVPGDAFGAPGYLRMSFASAMEQIKEATDRLEKAIQGLRG